MPFVQITLKEGRPESTLITIGEAIHESLIKHFNIPADDKFQTIREVTEPHLVFPDSYLEIPHTSEIIFIQITAKEGRTTEMKKDLFKSIAKLIHERTNMPIEDIFIVLVENKAENWSFGNGEAQLA
jgi:phenylpyruvate tautomerase PptA (4-oxalocrotonate tautomerase family)